MGSGASFLPDLLGTLGYAYAASGDDAAAREVLEELRRLEQRVAVTAYERALVATGLGEWDEAMAELSAAAERCSTGALLCTSSRCSIHCASGACSPSKCLPDRSPRVHPGPLAPVGRPGSCSTWRPT